MKTASVFLVKIQFGINNTQNNTCLSVKKIKSIRISDYKSISEPPFTEDPDIFSVSCHNKLTVVKVRVETVLLKQFTVISLFNYIAVFHYKDNVGVLYG